MRITVDCSVDTPAPFDLERMTAREELGRPYLYDVVLLSTTHDLQLSPLLGELIVVHVELAPGVVRHFGGHVTHAVALGNHGRLARYRFSLRPWLSLLSHTATCRIWQNKTVVDVLKDVASKAGFSVDVASPAILSGRELEFVVQYRESDYNFFMRLVEQEGLFFYFRQEADKHDLLLTDSLLDHDSAPEKLRFAFQPTSGGHDAAQDVFETWTLHEKLRTSHYELDDYDYTNANADLFVRSGEPVEAPPSGSLPQTVPDRVIPSYDYPGDYLTAAEGTTLSAIRQQEQRADRQLAFAEGNMRSLGAGSVFTLFSHENSSQNQEWAVTAMTLTLEAAAMESGHGSHGFAFHGNYAMMRTSLPFRLKRTTAKPVIAGPQTAIVVGPKNQEIKTDAFGRVRVQFRWDRTDYSEQQQLLADGATSCWIRVAQPWASGGFGFQFIPRIGDEVVVQFLEGDPDRPLITGSVYNSVNRFPFAPGSNPTQSGIKTRSSKDGGPNNANEIRFEDKKDAEELFVQAERDHTVRVKNNRSVSVGGNETYGVKGTRHTTIAKKNTDTYEDEHEMKVTGRVTEIFDNEHWLSVKEKQTIEVMNDKSEYIDKGYELTTSAKFLLTQGGAPGAGTSMKLEGDAFDLDVKGPLSIVRGSAKITVDESGTTTIESPTTVVVKCGGNTIELSPAGVKVVGTQILLNA